MLKCIDRPVLQVYYDAEFSPTHTAAAANRAVGIGVCVHQTSS